MKRRTFRQVVRDGLRLLWSDVKEIKWVIMGIIAYFVVLRTFFHGGCPWVLITGMPCPECVFCILILQGHGKSIHLFMQ